MRGVAAPEKGGTQWSLSGQSVVTQWSLSGHSAANEWSMSCHQRRRSGRCTSWLVPLSMTASIEYTPPGARVHRAETHHAFKTECATYSSTSGESTPTYLWGSGGGVVVSTCMHEGESTAHVPTVRHSRLHDVQREERILVGAEPVGRVGGRRVTLIAKLVALAIREEHVHRHRLLAHVDHLELRAVAPVRVGDATRRRAEFRPTVETGGAWEGDPVRSSAIKCDQVHSRAIKCNQL